MEKELNQQQLDQIINYLKEKLYVSVLTEKTSEGNIEVQVTIYLDGDEVNTSRDWIYLS